jgi:hypothetical protein
MQALTLYFCFGGKMGMSVLFVTPLTEKRREIYWVATSKTGLTAETDILLAPEA